MNQDIDSIACILLALCGQFAEQLGEYRENLALLRELILATPNVSGIMSTSRIRYGVRLKVEVLDLTNSSVRGQLDITENDLIVPTRTWQSAHDTNEWTACQDIGRAAWLTEKFNGILVPTALPIEEHSSLLSAKENIVLLMDPQQPTKIRGEGEHKLEDDFIEKCNQEFLFKVL